MKKALVMSLLAVAATMTAGAKTADELRVYINPGHGSWTANDRPCTLVGHGAYSRTNTDTLSFFESNTNLRKGFGVLERLIQYGLKFDRTLNQTGERWQAGAARDLSNNIVMSHVKCGPYHDDNGTASQLGEDKTPEDLYYYNRNLTEICEEVEANNFDMFISIHSNAATEGTTTNYPLFLYRGYDTPAAEEGLTMEQQNLSRKMADVCWDYAYSNPHMVWTAYANGKNLRGDLNFYGSGSIGKLGYKGYLGVLKHGTPGFLVEGYFHTYQPARHRAMNWDVDRVEGIGYARGIADYFGLEKEKTGTIYGIVRDLHERFTDAAYKPNPLSNDIYLPINGCTVTLMKDGEPVGEYTTDEYFNGAFVFDGVEPGKYTISFDHPDYKAIDPIEVEVKAAENVYPTAQMEAVDYVPPTVVYETYPDPAATIAGTKPAQEYAFTATYTDEPIAELEGLTVRRSVVHDGKMYILALDKEPVYAQVVAPEEKPKSTIIVYDLAEKKVITTVSTEGAAGSILDISDIQVSADGYLLGCNQTKNQYSKKEIENLPDGTPEPRGTFYVYKWENDENGVPTGNPAQWMNTTQTGRWYRTYAAPTFAYTGTTVDGQIIMAQPSITAPNHVLRWTVITVTNGMSAGCADILHNGVDFGEAQIGKGFRYITSPTNWDNFLTVGPNVNVFERKYVMEDRQNDLATGNDELKGLPGTIGAFKYAGASYLVAPAADETKNAGIRLIDITDGIANAKTVSTINTTLEGLETANVAAAGEVEAVYDEINEVYTAAYINLYLLRDGKVTKLTTKDTKQPVHKHEFAYDLKSVKGEAGYTITYKATGAAPAATLVLTPAEGEVKRIEMGAPVKGENTFTLADSELLYDQDYTWAVEIENIENATAGEYMADPRNTENDVRGGVVALTDPRYDTFGYTIVNHGRAYGVDIYNPEGEKVSTRLWKDHATFGGAGGGNNQSNPFRGHEFAGKVLLAGWGDKSDGIILIDPLATNEPSSMFAGENDGKGNHVFNGANLGGGTAGICVLGEGETTRIYSFSEDHLANNSANTIVRYDLGNNPIIDKAPVDLGWGSLLANTNVDLLAYGNGFFAAQVRGAGNNAEGTPGFVYFKEIDGDIDVAFNSATIEGMDNCNSGIAVSPDGKFVAVGETKRIAIYDATWTDGVPALTFSHAIPNATTVSWSHMRFDAGNNLHVYERENNGYHAYAIADAAPIATTAAKAEYVLKNTNAVDNIAVDAVEEGEAIYYNLNGIQVDAENLVPGVYVKVVGNTATKVVVK